MNVFSRLWLNTSSLFDVVQYLFNQDFWGAFVGKFGNFSGEAVLDVACGTGKMRDAITPSYYVGIDINEKYIDLARRNYADKNETYFLLEDAAEYKPAHNFDTVFLVGSAHHLSNEQMRRIFRIAQKIKPKKFIVVDGVPEGYLRGLLKWLDEILGGGKYFREEKELENLINPYFKIKESGKMRVRGSFYYYPYVVAES